MTSGQDDENVIIVESSSKLDNLNSTGDSTLIIEEELRKCSQKEYDRAYAVLSNADIDDQLDSETPVHEISWQHIVGSREDFGRLVEYVLFGRRLQQYVVENSPTKVTCSPSLPLGFSAVVGDIASEEGIQTARVNGRPTTAARMQRAFLTSVLILPFITDQLISLVVGLVRDPPDNNDCLFVPSLGRLASVLPVLEVSESGYEVAVSSNLSSWLWILGDSILEPYDPVPVSAYTSSSCLLDQLSSYFQVTTQAILTDRLANMYAEKINEQLDVPLQCAPAHAILNSFRTRLFISILLYDLYSQMINRGGYNCVVTGGLDPGGRALIAAGITKDISTYHIPHSIGMRRCPNPPPELNQFVSGIIDKKHIEDTIQVHEPWNCLVTGHPYLTELYGRYHNEHLREQTTDPYNFLIATQPIQYRDEFVETAVAAITQADVAADIIIKIHPSESIGEFAEYTDNPSVKVADSDLHEHLRQADLTLTMNSNVGLESIIVGTPCICLNWWKPIINDPLYTKYDGVPVIDAPDGIHRFCDRIDDEMLAKLLKEETEYIHENYELQTNAAREIAAELESNPTVESEL